MTFSVVEILEEFVDARAVVHSTTARALDGTDRIFEAAESIQYGYRVRRRLEGLCRSCSRPAAPNRASCPEHLEKANARARASQERREAQR